ncbi:MAG: hypothetical protein IT258_17365 [Saprospiraceae bacterium]|nr:hypothetical protein [Saprospiraceae bacterium]
MRLHFFILILLGALAGCYEPTEGCLDIDGTNYDPSADDPCSDCCTYPSLSLLLQHHVIIPTNPDTSVAMKYGTRYPSPLDTNHLFYIDRCRFFVSDLKLVRANGEELGVLDSVWLPLLGGDSVYVENNFSKQDRDIYTAVKHGTIRTSKEFQGVKFTVGLSPTIRQVWVDTLTAGLSLAVENDTLSYRKTEGILPFHLIIRRDTMPDSAPIDLVFKEERQISLPFPQTVFVDRGFKVKVTLRLNYMTLFKEVDFKNDSETVIWSKIDSQLANAFSVVSMVLE